MMAPSSPPAFDDIYRTDTTTTTTNGDGDGAAAAAAAAAASSNGNGSSCSSGIKRNNPLVGRMRGLNARVQQGISKAKVIGKDKVLPKMGQVLQKINLPRLIDEMEHDQELADDLQVMNDELLEEEGRKRMVRQATAACQQEMERHLDEFLQKHYNNSHTAVSTDDGNDDDDDDDDDNDAHAHAPPLPLPLPLPRYEEWIQDLHPENVAAGHIFDDFKEVDLRFYVHDSDHRLLWNARMMDYCHPERQVAARSFQHLMMLSSCSSQKAANFCDLLDDDDDDDDENEVNQHTAAATATATLPLSSTTAFPLPPPPPPPLLHNDNVAAAAAVQETKHETTTTATIANYQYDFAKKRTATATDAAASAANGERTTTTTTTIAAPSAAAAPPPPPANDDDDDDDDELDTMDDSFFDVMGY
jgi:hypothetical protein